MSRSQSERVYLWLMRLALPKQFLSEAESEMLEVFRDASRSAAGFRGGLALWSRLLADLAVVGWHERRAAGMPAVAAGVGASTERGSALRGCGIALDVRAAFRELARRPVTAVLHSTTLGVGIAASVLMLILVTEVLLKPLPFTDPESLVRLRERTAEGSVFWPSYPNIVDWREQATALEGVIAANIGAVKPVLADGVAFRVPTGSVSAGFFETLGVPPVTGRLFTEAEQQPGGPAVALLSEELWRSRFGSRPLSELTLQIGRETLEIIGVVPAGFRFLGDGNGWLSAGVWTALERNDAMPGRRSHGYQTVARLRPGQDLMSARTAMTALAVRMKETHGEPTSADDIIVQKLTDAVNGSARTPLMLLLVASLGVLLVSCLNLAAALLARGMARQRELSVRAALGARRQDLLRLQLVHAGALALPGAVIGVAGAWSALQMVRAISPATIPRLADATMSPEAVGLALAVSTATAVSAGTVPALAMTVRNIADNIRTHGLRGASRHHNRLWDRFVAAQTALTLVLLVTSVLLLRSLVAALSVDLGYEPLGVTIVSLSLPESNYEDGDRRIAFYENLLRRLRESTGVEAAGITNILPDEIYTRSGPAQAAGDESRQLWSAFRAVDSGFFDTMRIPLLEGSMAPGGGVLVDQNLTRALWEGESPTGGMIESSQVDSVSRVAGLVGSVRLWNQASPVGTVYGDFRQHPDLLLSAYVVVRGRDPDAVVATIRGAMEQTDAQVPFDIGTYEARLREDMAGRELILLIALGFAAVSLILAAAGVHAMVSQSVERRHRESGIRLILGEAPSRVTGRMVGTGLRNAVVGIMLGALASAAAAYAIRSQLFGIPVIDPVALLASAGLLLGASALAAWLPARRAGRVDPAELIRGT